MKAILATIILCATCQSSQLHLVLTPAQFTAANNWLNSQNGWPDGKGTVTYAQPMQFSQFSNAATGFTNRNDVVVDLTGKVGLVLDKSLIRHCMLEGETKQDAIVRIVTIIRNNLTNPTVVRVVPTGDEQNMTADFTDVTETVIDRVKAIVN